MAELLCQQFEITKGHLEIGLDGESVIKKLQSPKPPSPTDRHYDMLMDCRIRIRNLPIRITFRWIQGHQDSNQGKGQRLDWWACQNIRMDHLAKRHWRSTHTNILANHMFKHKPWAITVLGEKLSSFNKETIHEQTNAEAVTKYW